MSTAHGACFENKAEGRRDKNFHHERCAESSYTEKIQELDQNFDYSSNSDRYWGEPELSLLYGTPLYEEASPSQKLALN